MIYRISYLKIILFAIGTCTVPAAVFTLTSCGGESGKPYGETQDTPAGIYREYLSELRTQDRLSFEDLTARLGQWQAVRDSVSAHIRRDTLWRSHTDTRKECLLLHDHPYGIFPSGAVETAHLSRGAGTERTLLSIRRRRGAASLRAGNTPVLRLTGQPHGIPGRQGTAPVGVPHASLRDTAQGHTRA